MKKRELKEYKIKPQEELKKELIEKRNRLIELKFQLATGKVKSLREWKATKKAVAQIETILSEREKEK